MTLLQRRRAEPFLWEGGPVACLLLHGFGGSPAEVRPLGEHLARQGITVLAPLLPGHGTSPEDLSATRWPQWVRAAEQELAGLQERHGHVQVVGFSMGGLLSLYLAAHHTIASVVTLSCPSALSDRRQLLVPLARHFIRYYPARISKPEVAAEAESYDRLPVNAVHSLLHLIRRVRNDLPRVQTPVLAMQGDRDRVIVPESAEYILAHVSSGEREQRLLTGRGHMITLEHGREEVFTAVADWLKRHGQRTS